jgi:hypothetical protein
MTAELIRELELTLEAALLMAEPETSVRTIAERLYDSESVLMEKIGRSLVVERIVWMLYRKRQRFTAANQLCLPGFEGLPARITMKDGTRRALRSATLELLQEFREVLLKRKGPRLRAVEKLIVLVSEYNQTFPGIVVGEVINLEIERTRRKNG